MKFIGSTLIILGIVLIIYVFYTNSRYDEINHPFSTYTLVTSSWQKYKEQFINKDGRVIDVSQGDITTSEGQSYAMLRSVWIDDKETFDLVWKWTRENLKRPNDSLLGWRWGKRDDNSYGFISNGENSATDADIDVALALILASRRWSDKQYAQESQKILQDLWEINTEEVNGIRYVIAGNWAKDDNFLIINPSYFAPYAWRIFAQIDKERDWLSLINPSYELLNAASKSALDKKDSVGLPPDWVTVNRLNGEIVAPVTGGFTTNYSFDAIRIPWRIALDYQWNGEKRAYEYLSTLSFLEKEYTEKGQLHSSYAHDGVVLRNSENPAMYATSLGYFSVINPKMAAKIYEEKIISLYSNDTNSFRTELPYYEQNWLWFGVSLHSKQLKSFI